MKFVVRRTLFLAAFAVLLSLSAQAQATLKDACKGLFHVGVAINSAQITGADAQGDAIIASQFDSITPENVMKWEVIHPLDAKFDFTLADKYVEFGERNHMFIVGHNLVWHSQTPDWVFQDAQGKPISREALLQRMHDHIFAVVGRYKGRIQSWDVVNEALNEDGTLRKSKWMEIIGEDYLVKAYQWAHEADPSAELNYNDYSLELPKKRAGAVALVKKLQAAGVKIAVVGVQGHDHMKWPTGKQEEATINALAALGVKIAITELDIDVLPSVNWKSADVSLRYESNPKMNPYAKGLPDAVQKKLAARYKELFAVYNKHREVMSRVTFWGLSDKDSWLNDWPVRGRSSYPLLWDRKNETKPAFQAVLAALK